jgi:hypothetical protein
MLKPEAELRGNTSADLIKRILETTPLKLRDPEK